MADTTVGDPIRAYAAKLHDDMERAQGRTVRAVKKQAVRAAMLAARQRGGKATSVVHAR